MGRSTTNEGGMKFRKKPVVIEAEQYGGTIEECAQIAKKYGFIHVPSFQNHRGHMEMQTLEGPFRVSLNDWIITGIQGERSSRRL